MTRQVDEPDTLITAMRIPTSRTRTTNVVTVPATAEDEMRKAASAKASAVAADEDVEVTFATRFSRCYKSARCTGTR
jgi:hypothetical protein